MRLYPGTLGPDSQADLRAQYKIDYYKDMPVTLPDFAFPDAKIAIYCDGYEYHSDSNSFQKDRQQSRELQLKGWTVLRFGGSEILNDTEAVVATIQRAVKRVAAQQADRQTLAEANRQQNDNKQKSEGGFCGLIVGTLIVVVVVIILLEIFIW